MRRAVRQFERIGTQGGFRDALVERHRGNCRTLRCKIGDEFMTLFDVRFRDSHGSADRKSTATFIRLIAIDRNLFILLILSMQFFISSRIVFDARDLCIVKWKYFGTTDFDFLRYFRR